MLAHEHYRKGNYKDAIVGAENAFESSMKTICERRSWDYSSKPATAKNLIDVLWNHKLIPSEMQSHFTALRSTLESGLPTGRIGSKMAEFAYELCHTKRKVNADQLARIT